MEYRFDRYRNGRKMAEGLVLTKPKTVDDAVAVASRLAEAGDVFVLREDLTRLAAVEAERDDLHDETESLTVQIQMVRAERDAARAEAARAVEALRDVLTGLRADLKDRNPEDYARHGLVEPGYCEALQDVTDGLEEVLYSLGQPALDWLAQREREAAAEAERRAENAALRKIAVDLHWMARRYADGRMSTAPEMFNDAVKVLLAMGIKLNPTFDRIIWARNSMGRRYDGLTHAQATLGTPEALGEAAALRAGEGGE